MCFFFNLFHGRTIFRARLRYECELFKVEKMKTSICFYNKREVPSTSVVSTSSTTDAPVPEPVEGTATKPKLP